MSDAIVSDIAQLHDGALEAGRLYVGGDLAAAVEALADLRILAGEICADLGRALGHEQAA